jgi:EamA domain-containing membrane protein RarD
MAILSATVSAAHIHLIGVGQKSTLTYKFCVNAVGKKMSTGCLLFNTGYANTVELVDFARSARLIRFRIFGLV